MIRHLPRAALLCLVPTAASNLGGCGDNAVKEWVAVAPGAVDIALAADGRFVGLVGGNAAGSTASIAQSGDDPTQPWSRVPRLDKGSLTGFSTRRPLVYANGRVWVARDGDWVDIAPTVLPSGGGILAVDASGRWVVRQGDGTLERMGGGGTERIGAPLASETPVVAPDGRVFAVDVATANDLLQFEGGKRTALLGTTGCGEAPGCPRFVRLVGFDDDGGVYVSVIPSDSPGGIPLFRWDGSGWSALPRFDHASPDGQIACGVGANGAVYCQSDEDFGDKLYRLGRGDDEWSDLGLMPTISACRIVPRDDGRVAMRCGALSAQSGNSELFVSRN